MPVCSAHSLSELSGLSIMMIIIRIYSYHDHWINVGIYKSNNLTSH